MTRADAEKLRRHLAGSDALPEYFVRLILQRIAEGDCPQQWLDRMLERILYLESVLKGAGSE
jgi:hypothetical protein